MVHKIGLKANAAFLFQEMKGDIMGSSTGEPYYVTILNANNEQFKKFKKTAAFYGCVVKKTQGNFGADYSVHKFNQDKKPCS